MGEENPIITIKQGLLKGKSATDYNDQKYYSFQNIPYAEPPLGKLRFKSPQPAKSWEGIRDATKEGNECYSHHMIERHIVGSEDCLFLNVYTPVLPQSTNSLKPVMVWIHGGAFTTGSSKTDVYGPDYLITEDVVIVTVNYRVGILGFLALEDPDLDVPGNAAFKDMTMALKWVQQNISTFGGNPNNVTIFGESAGGASVHFLMLSPITKGLFHKAIVQSGCALNVWARGSYKAKIIAEKLGFHSDSEKEILNFLQEVPVDQILFAQDNIPDVINADKIRPHGPVVEENSKEEAFLPENPLDIILKGKFNDVPLMIGYTDAEGMLFDIIAHRAGLPILIQDFEAFVPFYFNTHKGSQLSQTISKKIQDFYFGEKPISMESKDCDFKMRTDLFFVRGIYKTVLNHMETAKCPIYLYRITIENELALYKGHVDTTVKGVCHADELGYLWKTSYSPKIKKGSIEEKTVQRMAKLWTTFAKYGNPNPLKKDPLIPITWHPVKKGELNFLDIGEDLLTGVNPEYERMAFWDELHSLAPHTTKL